MRWRRMLFKLRLSVLRFHQGISPRTRIFLIIVIVIGNAAIAWKTFQKQPAMSVELDLASLAFTLDQYRYALKLPSRFQIVESGGGQILISVPDQRFPPQLAFFSGPHQQAQNATDCTETKQGMSICYEEEMRPNGNGPLNKHISGYVSWDDQTSKLYFSIDEFAELSEPEPGILLQFLRFLRREPA